MLYHENKTYFLIVACGISSVLLLNDFSHVYLLINIWRLHAIIFIYIISI